MAGPAELLRDAEALMRRREWARAAATFEQLPTEARDLATGLKLNLSKNLAALQVHRPGVYDTLLALPAQNQFAIALTPSGHPTVQCRRADGSVVRFAAGPDPLAAAGPALPKLYERTANGDAVALCGVGDGYLLRLLAQRPPALFMDRQQPLFVIEPQAQVLLQCLMIHDFTGPAGPIQHPRFHWFVGPDWQPPVQQALLDDLYLPCPTVTVGQGFDAQAIQAGLGQVLQRLGQRDRELATAIARHYAGVTPEALAPLFEGRGNRPPRVLLLTTRFSTVLQFSTRDTAAAFERLGWEARVVIEPSPAHRVLRTAIAAELASFKPDLVFQIDHLRHEHQGLFPRALPFACWIQDHLPHLASKDVGRQVGELDFVLTDAIATYVDKFDYPARQCIPCPKLVVRTEPAELDGGRADDLVFVSNASANAKEMIADGIARFARNGHTQELIARCCRSMLDTYERGESLPTYNHVCGVLRTTLAELGLSLPPDGFDVLARWLTHPFNDALYRQQALAWAADVAGEMGLTLALYGKGWEKHPRFAPHARGPVEYGEPLRRLTRRSRINLQVVPYLCLHQRLLDGLMAGGFFLIRAHPADVAPAELLRFVETNGDVAPARLVERCRPCLCTTGDEDVIAMVRAWQEAGQLCAAEGPLPMFDEVCFDSAATLAAKTSFALESPLFRQTVVDVQRRSVANRLSYDAGIRRVVGRIGRLLAERAGDIEVRRAA
jgi:hypothetical protein